MMVFAPACAWASKRVALVIGNSAYENVLQLPNPAGDAQAVAKMLNEAGFDSVDLEINVGNLDFKRVIRKFEVAAAQADIAVIYYAGHGLEIGGTNYLIPVDARLASDNDADDEAILLERLVSSANEARTLRLVILDACRDNPLERSMRRDRKTVIRSVNAGLGSVMPTTTGTLIAYAAKAGSRANDGSGGHSPFTAAILKHLPVPGLDIRLAFGRVRDEVMKETGNEQEPFVYGSLGGANVALVPAPAQPEEVPVSDVKADFELVKKIGSRRAWEVFLNTHPRGPYAELARAEIETIDHGQGRPLPETSLSTASRDTVPAKEEAEWGRLRESSDLAQLTQFIRRYPYSRSAVSARARIDEVKKAAAAREEQMRAAARQATEEARAKAEQEKAEAAARRQREQEEQRTQASRQRVAAIAVREAACREQQVRLDVILARGSADRGIDDLRAFGTGVSCERLRPVVTAALERFRAEVELRKAEQMEAQAAAQKEREEQARRARLAEADRKAKEAEAARRAEKAEQERRAAEAAAQKEREEQARRTRLAEADRKAKEAEAARKAEKAEQERRAAEAATAARAAEARRAVEAEAAREAVCNEEMVQLNAILAREADQRGIDELKSFGTKVRCHWLHAVVVTSIERFTVLLAKHKVEQDKALAAAQKKRDEDEKRAAALEAERKANEAQAARQAEAERQRLARLEQEKQAAAAAAATEAAMKEAQARQQAQAAAAKEAVCRDEQTRLDAILAKAGKGGEGGVRDLKAFSGTVSCERLRPVVMASIEQARMAARPAAGQPNSLELVKAAQGELIRLGCFTGRADGSLWSTQEALNRYLQLGGGSVEARPAVTAELVERLSGDHSHSCPLRCSDGVACAAGDRPRPGAPGVASQDNANHRPGPNRQREEAQRQKPANPNPPRHPAARPSIVTSANSGVSNMIGVGF
ncbi:MAG: caspase family protein [Alphaproteobacteria bacterium]|nr:caspase family protein [Alphaproteobacteria bacterium]